MLKDFFLNEVKNGINKAIEQKELGQMENSQGVSLIIEKPKNPDFGDFAVNVSSLARSAKIAPPMIANAIVKYLSSPKYSVSVVGGFINFKIESSMLADVVAEVLEKGENYGRPVNVPTEKNSFGICFCKPNRSFSHWSRTLGCNGQCTCKFA